ncbi:MAG: helix-turn-helix domain-containing protein [Clostridia bacterium]|nr:helix-turn-helix domain-containing protein [Clostridia bacterium]MBR3575849.1 helix-turn-helix domain-containing protein [Clostridia bacterium]
MTEEEMQKISDITAMYNGVYLTAKDINAASAAGAIFEPVFYCDPDAEEWFKNVLYENHLSLQFNNIEALNSRNIIVVLDTETTGLEDDDEVIELGIVDKKGRVLYNSRFKNQKAIHWAAAKANKIKKSDLENAPLFKDEWPKIKSILAGKRIMAFNTEFDCRLIGQTLERYGLDKAETTRLFYNHLDAMKIYLSYFPNKSNKISLQKCCDELNMLMTEEHKAVSDCRMTLLMLHELDEKIKLMPPVPKEHTKISPAKSTFQSSPKTSELLKSIINNGIYDITVLGKEIGYAPSTVETIIFRDFTPEDIDFSMFIQPQYEKLIKNTIENLDGWNGRLRPIKDLLPEDVSYTSIKATIKHYALKPQTQE